METFRRSRFTVFGNGLMTNFELGVPGFHTRHTWARGFIPPNFNSALHLTLASIPPRRAYGLIDFLETTLFSLCTPSSVGPDVGHPPMGWDGI